MSLTKPQSPVFITESAMPATDSAGLLDSNENATRVNQLHGIAATNAIGAGIPKQVSNVQASVANAQTGSTCTVTVLYRIDPTDRNIAGVNIWAKGYQGNTQLVRVASGVSSPTKFVLNNTGEIVSFVVQAYGNGGGAPLTGSPSCSGTLPQATSGGFGSSSNTAPSVRLQHNFADNASQSLLNIESIDSSVLISNPSGGNLAIQGTQIGLVAPHCWLSGDGGFFSITGGGSGQWGTGTANQVKFQTIRLPYSIKVTKLTTRILTNVALAIGGFAVYDSSKNKVFSWDNIDLHTAGGVTLTTTQASVVLPPGTYYVAQACSITGIPTSLSGYGATGTNEGVEPWNTGSTVHSGTAANAMVAGVMPASLGALSPGGGGQTSHPVINMEP